MVKERTALHLKQQVYWYCGNIVGKRVHFVYSGKDLHSQQSVGDYIAVKVHCMLLTDTLIHYKLDHWSVSWSSDVDSTMFLRSSPHDVTVSISWTQTNTYFQKRSTVRSSSYECELGGAPHPLAGFSGLPLLGVCFRVVLKPQVLVLNTSEAFVVVPFSSEQLLVVKYAVQLSVQRCIIVHARNEYSHVVGY